MTSGRLSGRTEEVSTETLGHILRSSEAARLALQDFFGIVNLDIGEIRKIRTQGIGWQGGGRPDMAGYDAGGKERLLIEAKFWADLTQHQPVTYLRRLPDNEPSGLLFVVPHSRIVEIWVALLNRVSGTTDLEISNERKEREVHWCDVGKNRKLILTSWRLLLDSIAAGASRAVAQTVVDIHQLQGIVELRQIDSRPLNSEFPRSLPHLYALVDDTVQRLVDKSLASVSGYQPTVHRSYSVRYMTFCGLVNSSLGIYFRDWRTYHHSPLRFTVHNHLAKDGVDECAARRLTEAPFHGCQNGTHIYIPIHLQGHDYQEVLKSMVEQIERIAALLKADIS